MPNQYANRNVIELDRKGGHFTRHMEAMTAEDLVDKADIAAELAYRDFVIHRTEAEKTITEQKLGTAAERLASVNSYCQQEGIGRWGSSASASLVIDHQKISQRLDRAKTAIQDGTNSGASAAEIVEAVLTQLNA